jgi:protein translocase SecG subunit
VGIFANILTGLLILLSISLVAMVLMQTPKSDGFTGGVTNATGGGFRGKAGNDEILSNYTRMIAIGWFVTAFALGVISEYAIKGGAS